MTDRTVLLRSIAMNSRNPPSFGRPRRVFGMRVSCRHRAAGSAVSRRRAVVNVATAVRWLLDTESCWSRAEASLFADYGFAFGPTEKDLLIGRTLEAACANMVGLVRSAPLARIRGNRICRVTSNPAVTVRVVPQHVSRIVRWSRPWPPHHAIDGLSPAPVVQHGPMNSENVSPSGGGLADFHCGWVAK